MERNLWARLSPLFLACCWLISRELVVLLAVLYRTFLASLITSSLVKLVVYMVCSLDKDTENLPFFISF